MELGKDLLIKKDGTEIAGSQSCSFSLQRESIDVSTKDSEAVFKEYGKYSATISSEHLVDYTDKEGVFSLDDALIAGTKVTASWIKKSEATGDISYSASWIVITFDLSADDNSAATASISLESDGPITRTVAA